MPEVIDAIRDNGLALVALVLVSGFLVSSQQPGDNVPVLGRRRVL